MRLIVNERQYKELLSNQKQNLSTGDEWVNYISDFTITNLEDKNLLESVLTNNNLKYKLGKFNFYKKLPIDNIILNVYSEENSPFNSEFDEREIFINENKQIKNVNINITIDKLLTLEEQIDKNNLKLTLHKIKEWYENNNK